MNNIPIYDQLRQQRSSSFDDDDLELPELRPKSLDDYEEPIYGIKNRNGEAEDFDDDAYLLAHGKSETNLNENSGKWMARVLPTDEFNFGNWRFTLNPGRYRFDLCLLEI